MNINYKSLIFIFILLVTFASSCHWNDFKKGEKGYQYKIVREGNGPEFENNHFILMHMDYYYEDDSLLFSWNEKNIPVTLQYIDSVWENSGQIYHGMNKLKVGDSAVFKVDCADLYEVAFRRGIPHGLNPFGEITVYVGIEGMLDRNEFRLWQADQFQVRQAMAQRLRQEQLVEDMILIDIHLEEQGIIPMEFESGIRYVIREEGAELQPQKGDEVSIHYKGYMLDGTEFNSTYDTDEPATFTLGAKRVIPAWEEGVATMSLGAKYTFYVPSQYAYGVRGMEGIVEPNTVVVYDIELLEIDKKGN